MAQLSGPSHLGIMDVDLYQTSNNTTSPGPFGIGQYNPGVNGKGYRFGLVGTAGALVMGDVIQSSAVDTTYTNMAVATAAAAGDTTLNITNGTATITNAQFEGGSLSVYTAGTVAIGDEYTITSVTGTLTTGGSLTVQLDRPLRAAFTTSAKVNMRRSPWSGLIQAPATTLTGTIAGVAIQANAASTYGWVQTQGVGAVLSDGSSILVGSPVASPSGTAGAAILGATNLFQIGAAMQAAAAAHAIGVQLNI